MDYFDEIGLDIPERVLINLVRRPERKENAIKELNKAGIERYSIFTGFDGKILEIRSNILSHSGRTAIYLSHLAIINRAYEKNLNRILIMEDDLTFDPSFKSKFPVEYAKVPQDYDMIWVGSGYKIGRAHV